MTIRRIKTARQNYDIATYVGRRDEIFFGPDGILRYGDGVTTGGQPFGNVREGGLSQIGRPPSLSVSEINAENQSLITVDNVKSLKFDRETGFIVEDLGNGEVKVSLGSTFKTWKVDGQEDLIAVGEDVIRFEAGSGLSITTDPTAEIKTIRFDYTGEISELSLTPATTTEKGGVIIGNNLSITNNGVVTVKSQQVVEEVFKAPVKVTVPVENQGLLYKNNEWTNGATMFWSSKSW